MAKRMTWQEIQEAYPDRWVGLTEVEWEEPDSPNIVSAVVKYADKSGNELLAMQYNDKNLYSTYTTPDNVPFMFSNWAVQGK